MGDVITVSGKTRELALAGLPRAAQLCFRLAERIRRGALEVGLPDGRRLLFRGPDAGPYAVMTIRDYRCARRVMTSGDIGVAESYLRGEWDTPNLTEFLHLFCINQELMQAVLGGNRVIRWIQVFRHWLNRNTPQQARKNIHAHYDLGNDFYAAWLDPSMTYSSALFDSGSNDLSAAQLRKYQSLAQQIQLKPGQSVLEIGCGWGGFAEYAARVHGAHVVGLTISREQHDYARRRIFEAGLAEKVEIRMQDYRDERGQ